MSFLVDFVLCCLKTRHTLKNDLILMVCLGKRQLGSTPLNCFRIGHSYEAFTYLFGQNIFIHLLTANKNSPVDLQKLAITGKIRINL